MKEHEVFLVSFGVYPPDATLDPLLKRSAYGEGDMESSFRHYSQASISFLIL